jgi:signal transduction histidine kinase
VADVTEARLSAPARRADPLVRVLRAPWAARTWSAAGLIVIGAPIAWLACAVVAVLIGVTASLALTAVLAVPVLVVLFAASSGFTWLQRARFAGCLGVSIAPVPPAPARPGPGRPARPGTAWLWRLWAQAQAASTWRQIGYHLLSGLTATAALLLVCWFWAAGAVLATIALTVRALPDRAILGAHLHRPATIGGLTLAGLVIFLAAPWVTRSAAGADVALARALLSPSRSDVLARRVASLSVSRDEVVDAADAERRRIERDLHDGTQQRLVSIAMNLGLARTTLASDVPGPLRETIEQVHEEAKHALSELRDVVRGMHPAVLDELGLDAALSGIAARCAVPVRLTVDLPRRPPRTVETAAYFLVCEALANVAKHARASRVDIGVAAGPRLLRVEVRDDGRGGADPAAGTGLRGLAQRIRAVDGTFTITSPPGGPTTLLAELPCGS